MSKHNEVVHIQPHLTMPMRPEYVEGTGAGTEEMSGYRIVPRVKIIQPLTKRPLSQLFKPGDAVIVPDNQLLAPFAGGIDDRTGAAFKFVPLLFYPEWWLCNPLKLDGIEPMIAESTLRSTDPLAVKTEHMLATRNYGGLMVPHPAHPQDREYDRKLTGILNFVVVPYQSAAQCGIMMISFMRGEYMKGRKLINLISSREGKPPIFACVFQGQVAFREGKKGSWYGIEPTNPDDNQPWVMQNEYDGFKAAHEELKAVAEKGKLRGVDVELEEEPDTGEVSAGADAKY